MNEALMRRRNGTPRYLPVVSKITEEDVLHIVVYAARYVYHRTPENFDALRDVVDRVSRRERARQLRQERRKEGR